MEADAVASAGQAEIRLVGLASKAVRESVSRLQAALRSTGYRWRGPKVTINPAPADVKEDSAAFDLPTCLRPATAGKSRWQRCWRAAEQDCRGIIVPADNAAEAAVVDGVEAIREIPDNARCRPWGGGSAMQHGEGEGR